MHEYKKFEPSNKGIPNKKLKYHKHPTPSGKRGHGRCSILTHQPISRWIHYSCCCHCIVFILFDEMVVVDTPERKLPASFYQRNWAINFALTCLSSWSLSSRHFIEIRRSLMNLLVKNVGNSNIFQTWIPYSSVATTSTSSGRTTTVVSQTNTRCHEHIIHDGIHTFPQ